MSDKKKPSIGRIVHVIWGTDFKRIPGIITNVIDDETIGVTVFPGDTAQPAVHIEASKYGTEWGHQWHWPEIVPPQMSTQDNTNPNNPPPPRP